MRLCKAAYPLYAALRHILSRIRVDLPSYSYGGSLISVNLLETLKNGSMIKNRSGIQIHGIKFRDPFSGSTRISVNYMHGVPTMGHYVLELHLLCFMLIELWCLTSHRDVKLQNHAKNRKNCMVKNIFNYSKTFIDLKRTVAANSPTN